MTNPAITPIVALVLDKDKLTLFKPDATTIVIENRVDVVAPIIDFCKSTAKVNGQWLLPSSLFNEGSPYDPTYAEFEQKSSGLVRFFKVAKEKVKKFFNAVPDYLEMGEQPTVPAPEEKHLEELLQGAVPASEIKMNEPNVHAQRLIEIMGDTPNDSIPNDAKFTDTQTSTETIIAVKEGKVVPGIENVRSQVKVANKNNNTVGMSKLIDRMAAMATKPNHTVDDLLRFLERGDLPIADDGSIIAYKSLKRTDKTGIFRDIHSGRIHQKVGSLVFVDPTKVDKNRRNECSNGLHIARRGYIKSFRGDVLVICKIQPEDVIAVPSYDANKVRVCAYHIVAELPDSLASFVRDNKAFTASSDGAKLLANIIAGNHIGITSKVEDKRTGESHPVDVNPNQEPVKEAPEALDEIAVEAISNDDVNSKKMPAKKPSEVKSTPVANSTLKDTAQAMFIKMVQATTPEAFTEAKAELWALKKKRKCSFASMGVDEKEFNTLTPPEPVKPTPAPEPEVETVKPAAAKGVLRNTKQATKVKTKVPTKVKTKVTKAAPTKKAAKVNAPTSEKEQMLKLLPVSSEAAAFKLNEWKKKSKKSWTALGIPQDDVDRIKRFLS